MKPLCSSILVLSIAVAVRADETLYRYEGDVHPLDPSTGWEEFNPCDPPCSEFLEDGHFVRLWTVTGDNVSYAFRIAVPPDLPPPTLWVEWRFRSNFPLGPIFTGCDAAFSVHYQSIIDRLKLTGDSVITGDQGDFVLGLDMSEFHTYRFESLDGMNYWWSVDGDRFAFRFEDDVPLGGNTIQMQGQGGCLNDWIPDMKNEWGYVRYGEIDFGERIVATDPPEELFLQVHGLIDRFTATFDAANYVYLDEITVEATSGVIPTVIATRRRELDELDTVEFVLNQPIFPEGITTFTFDDGQTTNVVSYHYAPDDEDADNDGVPNGEDVNPLDPHVCRDADGDLCDDCSIGVDGDGPLPDFDPANDGPDTDGDGICDLSDNCVNFPNPEQADADGDGFGDACEECDADPNKSEPGICGCGTPDEGDVDGDTVLDCVDLCEGLDDTIDADDNGVPDCAEHIPTISAWGIVVLALLLLTAGKVFFSHRATVAK